VLLLLLYRSIVERTAPQLSAAVTESTGMEIWEEEEETVNEAATAAA
jgi:hypothetical protein